MAAMFAIYKKPADTQAFEKHYFEVHAPLAKKLPGLRRYEVSRGPVTMIAGSADIYFIAALYFDDLEAVKTAFASPEGQACASDRQRYAPDESGVQILVFDTREI